MVVLSVRAEHFSTAVLSSQVHVCLLLHHDARPGCIMPHLVFEGWEKGVNYILAHKYNLHSWDGIYIKYGFSCFHFSVWERGRKSQVSPSLRMRGGSNGVMASSPARIKHIKDWALLHINQHTGWQPALLSAPYIRACPRLSGPQVIYLSHW